MKRFSIHPFSGVAILAIGISICAASDLLAQNNSKLQPVSDSGPKRGYTISKETTFFSGPLKKDGTIDFVAAINEHFAKGVTYQNNAARIIVPLLDPKDWGGSLSKHRSDVLKSLGLDPAQHDGQDSYIEFRTMLANSKISETGQGQPYLEGLKRPWSEDEFPVLAKWLAVNEEPLAKISAAARMDRFFVPFVVSGETDSLVQILLEHVQATRGVARAYAIRANNHLANKRWHEAWDDILTIKNLGRLGGQGQTLIEGLVGVAITGMACQSATQFVAAVDSSEVDWSALQESWQTKPIANISEMLGVSERAMFIQMACTIWDKPEEGFTDIHLVQPFPNEFAGALPSKLYIKTLHGMLKSGEVKLDEALRFANQMYDRAIAISMISSPQDRKTAFEELDQQLVNRSHDGNQAALLKAFFAKPEAPAEQFAKAILGMVFPATEAVSRGEWRTEGSQHVVELALAARVIQSRTGDLPQSLRELEPLVEELVMTQPATGDPIAFRADDRGILMYHWSSNRVDDGGQIDQEKSASDWGIRIHK